MNKKHFSLKINRGSTLLLRAALLVIAVVVLIFSSFTLADIYVHWSTGSPELAGWRWPILLVLAGAVNAFFMALAQIWKLLSLIDKNKAFSSASVQLMRNVKYCGFVIGGLFAVLLPLSYYAAQEGDAPGLIIIYGTIFIGVPMVVAFLAGLAAKLFQNAIDIKSENDLTV